MFALHSYIIAVYSFDIEWLTYAKPARSVLRSLTIWIAVNVPLVEPGGLSPSIATNRLPVELPWSVIKRNIWMMQPKREVTA